MDAPRDSRKASRADRCEFLSQCPFFNDRMARMPRSVEIVKDRFCRDRFEECARWKVHKTLGPAKVPPSLFPGEAKEAADLIARHRAKK